MRSYKENQVIRDLLNTDEFASKTCNSKPGSLSIVQAGLGRTGTLIGLYVPAPSKGRRRLHFVLRLSYIAATPESDFTDLNNWNSTLKPQEAVLRIPEIPRCLGPELVDL